MVVKGFIIGPLELNCYLIWNEENKKGVIIDPGYYNLKLNNYINEMNITVEYIILTHGHGDHICGVPAYRKKFPNMKVIAHETEDEILSNSELNLSKEVSGKSVTVSPDIYIKNDETINLAGMDVRFIHTPGHTKGGMSILIGDYLFCGDTLFYESIGKTHFHGGSYDVLIASIKEKLFKLPGHTKVMPGHMNYSTIDHEKEHNPFLL